MKIKIGHDQLSILIAYLEKILQIQDEKLKKLSSNNPEHIMIDAEMELIDQLSIKLQKRHIDRHKYYNLTFLKSQVIIILKYQAEGMILLSQNPYFLNEIQLLTGEFHKQLINN